MRAPLIWTYNPIIANICESIPNSGIVYHCVDDLGAAPRIDHSVISAGEKHLGTLAKVCFATSPFLRDRMKNLFPHVVYEPNVCDQAFFETARSMPHPPPELANIPHPRVLFVGALSEYKVDYDLIETLAQRHPQMHWVLIGPVGEGQPDSRKPPNMDNIHILGPRAYGQLPYFMAHCDVAALPVPRNAYTDAMFPMKFFEYLAAGLPVVGSRLPALKDFEHLYFSSASADEFEDNLIKALAGERQDTNAIDAACRYHSWEARFARMEAVLDDIFPLQTVTPQVGRDTTHA
ncbi:MAG: glycosyltransferase [Desulfovibrio sp.]|uniref:glycosyltransferase n=1 Tax=Desulfovibrio sp. TaxID=885 RepID=UPI0039E4204B